VHVHQLAVPDALRALRSGPDGLAPEEAARRREEFGPNDLQRVERRSPWLALLGELTHFFARILWVAAALAFLAELAEPGAGMGALAVAIVGVIVVNGVFSFWQQHRAERALEALERLLPERVLVVRGGAPLSIEARELVPGDVVLLEAGARVPADCRVLEGFGLRVDEATLTGESVPVALDARSCEADARGRASNVARAGTVVVAGHGRALVFATGGATAFSRIAGLAQATRAGLSPLQLEVARVSRLVAALATGLGVAFFAIGQLAGLPFWSRLLFAVGIIVANVPEGLLPTITLSLAMAAQRMARRNALVRHLPSVEALGAASVICTDKTGTLTRNRMAAREVWLAGALHDVRPGADLAALAAAHRAFFEACLRCENLQERGRGLAHEWLGDPTEVALVELAQRALPGAPPAQRVDEIPFDSDRRRLTTVHRIGESLVLHCKGALESLLPLCDRIADRDGVVALDEAGRRRLLAAEAALGERGLRVLAVAWRPVAEGEPRAALEAGLVLAGLVALEDPPREEVAEAVARCRSAGIRVVMVTGDHPRTAVAIARQIGLVGADEPRVVTGERLRRMSDPQLQLALDDPDLHFARLDADQKTRIVAAFQRKGHVVAVTGDGVNDAPALKLADIGVAMGIAGTDAARAAADLVLADDHFATIVNAIEEGRAVFANARKFLTYILTSNVPEIVPYLAFVLLRIPLPLTVVQILAVDLGTDLLPALALGAERPDPGLMAQPPRSRRERLLSTPLLLRAYCFLGPIQAAAAMAAYFSVLDAGGWTWGQALAPTDPLSLRATTACLAAIVAMQVVNVFVCRSSRESLWRTGLRGNRLLAWGVAAELALLALAVYTPVGQALLGTAPLDARTWLLLPPMALAMLLLEEARKALVRRRARARAGTAGAG
jgi:calcium-translocating P-type ATPase